MSKHSEELQKEFGIELACSANQDYLILARKVAVNFARTSIEHEISIDDVRSELIRIKPDIVFGPWMGGVFRTPDWEFTGKFVKATHKGCHARPISVWRLKKIDF